MYCPNQNSPEWKKQKELLGEDVAFFAWDKNNGRSLEFAPNGEKSILFDELSKEYGEKKAYDIISKTHTKEFKDWFESKGGVYSSPEYKLADKVRKILKLRGIDKSFNVSDTNYGKSMYFTVYDDSTNKLLSKIRISDHSVSNIDRIFDEQHESSKSDPNRIANDIERLMYPERYNKNQTGSKYYSRYNDQRIFPKEKDIEKGYLWIKENMEKSEPEIKKDLENNDDARIISKDFLRESKSGNKVYKVEFERKHHIVEKEPIYEYDRIEDAPLLNNEFEKSFQNNGVVDENGQPKVIRNEQGVNFQKGDEYKPITKQEHTDLINRLDKTKLAKAVVENDMSLMKKPNGEIYGFVDKDGKVHLNHATMNRNTPIHEFGHLWIDRIKQIAPDLHLKGVELIKDSKYFEDVKNNPDYAHLDEPRQIDEAMAQAIGDKGEKVVEDKGLFQKLTSWINDVWTSIGAKFGVENLTPEQIADLDLGQFTDIANSELLKGKKLEQLDDIRFQIKQSEPKTIEHLKEENKETLPNIPVEKVFKTNEVILPKDIKAEAKKYSTKLDELPTETLNVDDLIPTQKNITTEKLYKVTGNESDPYVLKIGDKYYIQDGHHRVADAILKGEKTINAKVFEADDVKPKYQIDDTASVLENVRALKKYERELTAWEDRQSHARTPAEKKEHSELVTRVRKMKADVIAKDAPELKKMYDDIENNWFGRKDVEVAKAQVKAKKFNDEIAKTITKGSEFSQDDINQAIHIYNDLKNDPSHFEQYFNELNPIQQRIANLSQNLTPEQIKIADKIHKEYQDFGQIAVENGVISNLLDNYVRRVWDLSKDEKKSRDWFAKFNTSTSHSKQRTLTTILEGQAQGLELKTKGATNNLQALEEEIHQLISNKKFISDGMKLKVDGSLNLFLTYNENGYKEVKNPSFTKWVKVADVGTEKEYKGNDFSITPDGVVFEKKKIYAPEPIADRLNNVLGASAMKGTKLIDGLSKFNAVTKSTLLSYSYFHHQAYTRAYLYTTGFTKMSEANFVHAYKSGLEMFHGMTPEVEQLIHAGMTFGRIQDWEEDLVQQKNFITDILDKTKASKYAKDKITKLHEDHTDFLFKNFGLGLKVKSAVLEYRDQIAKYPDEDPKTIAKRVSEMSNYNFGGLHLERQGRNKTLQHLFRLFGLAPDWTESNIKTLVKAFGYDYSRDKGDVSAEYKKKETQMYQKFWGRSLVRANVISGIWNLAIAAPLYMAIDKDKTKSYWDEVAKIYTDMIDPILNFSIEDEGFLSGMSKIRDLAVQAHFMDADMTPIKQGIQNIEGKEYNDNEKLYFSTYGHFKDPIKWFIDPTTAVRNKASILFKFAVDGWTGKDWQGKRFTSIDEVLGQDQKGIYTNGKNVGLPKGGKSKGEFTRYANATAPDNKALQISEMPSYLLAETRGLFPSFLSKAITFAQGETDGFDAVAQGIGMNVKKEVLKNTELSPSDKVDKQLEKYKKLEEDLAEYQLQRNKGIVPIDPQKDALWKKVYPHKSIKSTEKKKHERPIGLMSLKVLEAKRNKEEDPKKLEKIDQNILRKLNKVLK